MALLKYTGFAHFRELRAEDFKRLGVEGQEAITFAREEVTEVTDKVAEIIYQVLGDEFEGVTKTDAKGIPVRDPKKSDPVVQLPPPLTDSVNPPAVDNPPGAPASSPNSPA